MRALLAGERPSREHVSNYFREFHTEVEDATEWPFRMLRDDRGKRSYERLADALDAPRHASILDIGCGAGGALAYVAARDETISASGIDLCEAEIERARTRLAGIRVNELVVGSAEALPFKDASFDGVISHLVAMLLPDLEGALREMRRVLKPGGRLALLLARPPDDPNGPLQELLRLTLGCIRERHPSFAPVNPGHDAAWNAERLRDMLTEVNFSVETIEDFSVSYAFDADQICRLLKTRYIHGSLHDQTEGFLFERVREWIGDRGMTFTEPLRIVVAS